MWDEIINPFLKFNGATVWELVSNFIPHWTSDYLSMLVSKLNNVSERSSRCLFVVVIGVEGEVNGNIDNSESNQLILDSSRKYRWGLSLYTIQNPNSDVVRNIDFISRKAIGR